MGWQEEVEKAVHEADEHIDDGIRGGWINPEHRRLATFLLFAGVTLYFTAVADLMYKGIIADGAAAYFGPGANVPEWTPLGLFLAGIASNGAGIYLLLSKGGRPSAHP